jgi:hypothetical protein
MFPYDSSLTGVLLYKIKVEREKAPQRGYQRSRRLFSEDS